MYLPKYPATPTKVLPTDTTFQRMSLEMMHKPFPSRGGAPFALKLSTGAFESVSKAMLICISDLNLVYLLLSNGYHFGAWRLTIKQQNTLTDNMK